MTTATGGGTARDAGDDAVAGHPGAPAGPGELGTALWRASNLRQAAVRAALRPHGLTHVQFLLLETLAAHRPAVALSQTELATRAGTDPMMTSQVVRALETAGLLSRSRHPGDARARLLAITAEGSAALDAARPAVAETDSEFFASVDRAALARILAALG